MGQPPRKKGKAVSKKWIKLFYLAFHLSGLNRIETGYFARNESLRRSIEKTLGFVFEGIFRQFDGIA
jgi:RimJ/RimL family protein N-acetyltransferase